MSPRTVWKYRDMRELSLPENHRIVHVGFQDGVLTLWVEVDPEMRSRPWRFSVIPTGVDIPAAAEHVHSWSEGPFVWHLYRERVANGGPVNPVNAYRVGEVTS